jgi:hypothetical protein
MFEISPPSGALTCSFSSSSSRHFASPKSIYQILHYMNRLYYPYNFDIVVIVEEDVVRLQISMHDF